MQSEIYLFEKHDLMEGIRPILFSKLFHDSGRSTQSIEKAMDRLEAFMNRLRPDTTCLLETEYVDKVYRNSYYHYFSTKRNRHNRNCLRISLFEGKWKFGDFRDATKIKEIEDAYRGFLVLRPTLPNMLGHNHINPKALLHNKFYICSASLATSANSLKLKAKGFPHQSQDRESISCAETSIWAIMDYFSTKYAEYKPALPHDITKALEDMTVERLVPSKGLNILQISYALRSFGFGTLLYSREQHGADFQHLFSCYIESGIPLIAQVSSGSESDGGIAHAMVCIGYEHPNKRKMRGNSTLNPSHKATAQALGIHIYDHDSLARNFVWIDDNHPPYQLSPLASPCQHYGKVETWENCKLDHFIAPLHPKIHLDVARAKLFVNEYVLRTLALKANFKEIHLRTYLTSQRSLKDWLVRGDFAEDLVQFKEYVLNCSMPKFVWVTELSTPFEAFQTPSKASGLIILDATEPIIVDDSALIFSCLAHQDRLLYYSQKNQQLKKLSVHLKPFATFENLNDHSI